MWPCTWAMGSWLRCHRSPQVRATGGSSGGGHGHTFSTATLGCSGATATVACPEVLCLAPGYCASSSGGLGSSTPRGWLPASDLGCRPPVTRLGCWLLLPTGHPFWWRFGCGANRRVLLHRGGIRLLGGNRVVDAKAKGTLASKLWRCPWFRLPSWRCHSSPFSLVSGKLSM